MSVVNSGRVSALRHNHPMPPRTKAAASGGAKSGATASSPDPKAAASLVFGASDYFYSAVVDAVFADAKKSDPLTEKLTLNGSTSTAGEVMNALGANLFGGASVVCIEESEALEEPAQQAVLETVAELTSGVRTDLRLILWHSNGVKARKFADSLRAAGIHEVLATKPKSYQLDDFLAAEFKRRKRKVEDAVPTGLRLALGEDLAVLMNAVRALCEDVTENPITVAHVGLYQPGVADVPGWEVADAVLEADPDKVMHQVRRALVADPNCAPALVAATASSLRQLVAFAPLRNAPQAQVAAEIGVPPFKIRTLAAQLRHWNPDTLARATVLLADADIASKGQNLHGEGLEPEVRAYEVERLLVGIASLPRPG